jgi:hypothetical protein
VLDAVRWRVYCRKIKAKLLRRILAEIMQLNSVRTRISHLRRASERVIIIDAIGSLCFLPGAPANAQTSAAAPADSVSGSLGSW